MSEALKAVDIFTDGACSGNPGPGGWAAILRYGQHELEISGSMPQTTNNRMEVFACISALGKLKTRCRVTVYSDSAYLVNAFNEHWIDNWQKKGWKTADGKPVENQDLWRLMAICWLLPVLFVAPAKAWPVSWVLVPTPVSTMVAAL